MKLFTVKQIAEIDRFTITHEPIPDIDLMERAARAMCQYLVVLLPPEREIVFFAGPGNNGGDAMAIARMMAAEGYKCNLYLLSAGRELTGSPAINWQRLKNQGIVKLKMISETIDLPVLHAEVPVIDGLFGSGLTRPLEGLAASLVRHINQSCCRVYAIDIPSGLMGEDNYGNPAEYIIRAATTLTLQFPKLSLLFAENEPFTGKIEVIDIGLHPEAIKKTVSPYSQITNQQVRKMLPGRRKHAHKGDFGHALLIAGSYGKMGAAILASGSCMRSGTGLLTTHIPACGYPVIQTASPETMCSIDDHQHFFTAVPDLEKFTAIGAGPGLGTRPETQMALLSLLGKTKVPLVLDADALNILSENKSWLDKLPENTILTPHPGEFRRLFGDSAGTWQRLELQRESSRKFRVIIVLKGAYTSISLPGGEVFFNPTGNPGMATGGSGDVLTGIILGLLAQGLEAPRAAITGVFIHGMAGDLAAKKLSMPAMIASDITRFLGKAFNKLVDARQQEF